MPAGWCTARVADLARPDEQPVLTGPFGTNLGREDFVNKGTPVLTIGCLTDSGVCLDKANYVIPDKAKDLDRYRLREGDILFSRMASVGRASIVPRALNGSLFNYHIMRLRLADATYMPQLFMYYVRGASIVRDYLDEVNHGATRDGVNTAQLLDMPVLLPPAAEQRRIVAKLEDLTTKSRRAKEALDAIPALLERFRQSVLAAAFRGDLTADWREKNPDVEPAEELLKRIRAERRRRWEEAELAKMRAKGKVPGDDRWKERYKEPEPADASELPELPEGWCWTTLGELAWSVKDGPHYSPKYEDSGVPFLSGGNIRPEGIDFKNVKYISEKLHAELAERCLPEIGDILYTKGGTTGIARVNTYDRIFNVWVHVAVLKLVSGARPFFVQHMLNSPACYAESQVLTHGVGNQDLGLTRMVNIALPLAPVAEQDRCVERIDAIISRSRALAEVAGRATELANGIDRAILAKAFRGELVPQDPNDEPASVLLERLRAEREQNGKTTNGAGHRRTAASPPPAPSDPTVPGRKPHASRRSQAPARSRG
ncbi:restriction endonuclease subunit S [Sorangium sp. So ce1504]|uniref:restriction endonuclease subunit S n=1 Tax=Sorangium sp. So ce1504 TaxID=3133337 RepID=UPI003F62C86D